MRALVVGAAIELAATSRRKVCKNKRGGRWSAAGVATDRYQRQRERRGYLDEAVAGRRDVGVLSAVQVDVERGRGLARVVSREQRRHPDAERRAVVRAPLCGWRWRPASPSR